MTSPSFLQTAEADLDVGLTQRHDAWLIQQYLRDLETLDRIERQREEAGEPPRCFFDGMGAVICERAEGRIA